MNPIKRILVVDDEPAILLLLEQVLSAEGYEVVTATNGEEAHRMAEGLWFDLFLIDLIMPRKDGIETILSLRTFLSTAPIIAMSGGWNGGAGNYLPLAAKLGASDTLAKPFERETLLRAVRMNLEKAPVEPQQEYSRKNHGFPSVMKRVACAMN